MGAILMRAAGKKRVLSHRGAEDTVGLVNTFPHVTQFGLMTHSGSFLAASG
jgi:hypothetical protein